MRSSGLSSASPEEIAPRLGDSDKYARMMANGLRAVIHQLLADSGVTMSYAYYQIDAKIATST
jgi:hypothetical protein